MLYHKRWADARYTVERRPICTQTEVDRVECAVTVIDDFGQALGYTATDTFSFDFAGPRLASVSFEGDDSWVFTAMLAWMWFDRGDVFEHECAEMFAAGTTPEACAHRVAEAAKDSAAQFGVRASETVQTR